MHKLLSVLLAIALVATMFVIPTVSNAAPGDAQLQLEVIEISGPSMEGKVGASSLIRLIPGETYKLYFRITMIPPTAPEVRVRFPESTIALTVNGAAVPFRHRELYKYQTSKGSGAFLSTDCFAEFVPDDSGIAKLEIKGSNVAGGVPVESAATAEYRYTPSTYAEIIRHDMRAALDPAYGDYSSIRIFEYGEVVYPTHLVDNGSEIWDIGSGMTFSRTNPPRTKIVFWDGFHSAESDYEIAYCQSTIGGIFRAVRFKYPDDSVDDYLMLDNGSGPILVEMLITCLEDSYPGDDPVPDINSAVHYVYCVTDPSAVQSFFNQDDVTLASYMIGEAQHGNTIPDLSSRLPELPDGALGWTENGADLYDVSANIYRRILLYPLFPQDSYSSFSVVRYDFGDAEFYWAHQDLYGGLRTDQTIEPPVAPIPNDGSMVFSHWIDVSGNIVDFSLGIPVTNGVYRAVYVKKAPLPPTTTPSVSSSGEQSSDSGEDYFPPVTTTVEGGSNPGTTTTDAQAVAPTDSTSASALTTTDIDDNDVPLGGVTTTTVTTVAETTASSSPTTSDDRRAADLPVTGLTANEVFWIGGGFIVLLGIILLVFNKKNGSKTS